MVTPWLLAKTEVPIRHVDGAKISGWMEHSAECRRLGATNVRFSKPCLAWHDHANWHGDCYSHVEKV